MRNVNGKGVGTWLKVKTWFSINSDVLADIAIWIFMVVFGYLFVVGVMAITPL